MTHVSLFTGIGGLDLAAESAGFETVLQVERDPYALRVLEKHWPDVPRITDVREVTSESVNGHVTVVSGGFPCQPFSAAGKRRGADDDRYLWPELLRIVEELRPSWVVGENVSGLLSIDGGMEIDRMLAALEARDYTPWVLNYPAAGVGAPHKRDRVFIVAHATSLGYGGGSNGDAERSSREVQTKGSRTTKELSILADADTTRLQRRQETGNFSCIWARGNEHIKRRGDDTRPTRRTEPGMGGMAHGLPDWMDGEPTGIPRVATGVKDRTARLKALGNAVVPAQAYPIFAAIAETEWQR